MFKSPFVCILVAHKTKSKLFAILIFRVFSSIIAKSDEEMDKSNILEI